MTEGSATGQKFEPARCTHPDVLPQGVCTNCGELVVITGQFRPEPVSGNEPEDGSGSD